MKFIFELFRVFAILFMLASWTAVVMGIFYKPSWTLFLAGLAGLVIFFWFFKPKLWQDDSD